MVLVNLRLLFYKKSVTGWYYITTIRSLDFQYIKVYSEKFYSVVS